VALIAGTRLGPYEIIASIDQGLDDNIESEHAQGL